MTLRSRLAEFLGELRRRRVFRGLIGWALASFAVLQVIEPVMHGLALPEWTLELTIWVLAAGFPVTAALSWTFDLGLEGITRTPEGPESDAVEAPRAQRSWLRLATLVLLSALVGGGLGSFAVWRSGHAPVVGTDGRITVAVADVANETRDPDLDGLSDLLITSLEQSKRLHVLTRSRMADVLKQLGRPAGERIDEPLARLVGRREGVRALLHASVRKLGETYAVDLRALDPVRDQYIFAVREQAKSKEAILDLVDRLSEQVRLRLLEPTAEVRGSEVHLADAATGTLEAWRHYVEGLRQEEVGRFDAAVAEWRQSIALDPRFALAWFRIALRGEAAGLGEAEREAALREAVGQIERVPPKERLLIRAGMARTEGRPAEALALLAPVADQYPRDKELAAFTGWAAWQASGPAAALPWLERALALDPTWGPAMNSLILCLARVGRLEEAVARARTWVARGPDVTALRQLVLVLQLAGRPEEAATEARRILDLDGSPVARGWLALALTRAGRAEEAEALVRPLASPSAPGEVLDALVDALEAQGRHREALEVVEWWREPAARAWGRFVVRMGDLDPGPSRRAGHEVLGLKVFPGGLVTGAAYLRDMKLFEASAAELPPGPSGPRTEYEALKAWLHGDAAAALTGLRKIADEPGLSGRRHWWRARVAFELGLVEEGEAALVRFEREPHGEAWTGWGRAQLLLYSAEAHARRGDLAKALASLDRLEHQFPGADRDFAQLVSGKFLRRRLGAGMAPAPGWHGGTGR